MEQKNILPRTGVFGVVIFDVIDGNKMIVDIRVRHLPIGQILNEKAAGNGCRNGKT